MSVAIVIAVSIVVFMPENEIDNESTPVIVEEGKIGTMLNKIEDNKIKNEESENPYSPQDREWNTSGPFKLDRSQYVLGEKLFVNLDYIDKNTKGQMIFSKFVNDTHSYHYKKIQFDGSKPQNNFYIGMNLNMPRGLCNAEQLVGDWELIFEGTNYESIKFKVLDQILPGSEKNYEPVC